MAKTQDISNKTLAILVVLAILISLVSTFIVLDKLTETPVVQQGAQQPQNTGQVGVTVPGEAEPSAPSSAVVGVTVPRGR